MCDTKKYPTVPEKADKILFAEDFVNHILLRYNLPLLSSGIAEHRAVIFNAFNPEIRLAANYLYDHLKEYISHIFSDYLVEKTINLDAFNEYAISLRFIERGERILRNENRFQTWFECCVKISSMAAEFYQHGFLDAPRLAVDYITQTINGIAMVEEGGWESLNLLATDYAQHFIDRSNNYMTPDEYSSDVDPTDFFSTDPSSRGNSDDSRSPDHEMDGRDDKERHPEKLTEDDLYKMCLASMGCSSEEPVSSSSECIPDEETVDVISENIVSISNNASDHVSSKSSQKKKSIDPRLSDLEMYGGVDQYELPEKLTDVGFCTMCLAAMSSSSEGPVYSMCTHVEKTIDVITENIVSFSDNTSDSISSGSPKDKNSETSLNLFEETSSEDDTSKRKVRKKKNMKQSNSYSKNSDSDSDKGEADLKTMDCIDSFTRHLTEKHSAVLSSPVKEHYKSDSANHIKTSNSGNLTPAYLSISSLEEKDRIHSYEKSSPIRKPDPNRRK